MLEMEAKLLLAAHLKMPHDILSISKASVQELVLVKSYLVSINNGVPEPYFPLSTDQVQQCFMEE